jgi:hypothetical protein
MKEDIEQAVLEMIKKSGVELGEGELESIIDASFNTASEHIECAILHSSQRRGDTYVGVSVVRKDA